MSAADERIDVSFLPCTVCTMAITGIIWQCEHGHLLCDLCKWNVLLAEEPQCPTCRQPCRFQSRNLMLEKLADQDGGNAMHCPYECSTKRTWCRRDLDEHVRSQCKARMYSCMRIDCTFRGTARDWASHFESKHPPVVRLQQDKKAIVIAVDLPKEELAGEQQQMDHLLWHEKNGPPISLVIALRAQALYVHLFAVHGEPLNGYELRLDHEATGTLVKVSNVPMSTVDRATAAPRAADLVYAGKAWTAILAKKNSVLTLSLIAPSPSKKRMRG